MQIFKLFNLQFSSYQDDSGAILIDRDPIYFAPILNYLRALKPRGKYITVGGNITRLLELLILKPIISRFTQKSIALVNLQPNKNLEHINHLFEAGHLRPVIDGPYPFSKVPDMIQYFGEGPHQGKVTIKLD